jgi:hypothetical protein
MRPALMELDPVSQIIGRSEQNAQTTSIINPTAASQKNGQVGP